MSEWKEQIKAHVASYVDSKTTVHKSIVSVLTELKSGLGYGVDAKQTALSPIEWNVIINIPSVGRVEFSISYSEIYEAGGSYDEIGNWIPKFPDDLDGAIKDIILEKVKNSVDPG
ncbi:hypothetical protein M1D70_09315 [Paenibacillus sp. AK002]